MFNRFLFSYLLLPGMAFGSPAMAQPESDHAVLSDPDGTPIVIGSVHRISSTVYGDEQIVTVRLPRGYADDPKRRYPVVFSVDGGPDQDFELLSGIAAEAEFSTSFEPFILIGVKTKDRYSQLTPDWTRIDPERLSDVFGDRMVPGGASQFRRYLETDIIPWATGRYRTGRKALTSVSLGGLFVIDTFLATPELFDDYIALTPSVWWDGGRIVDEAAAKLAKQDASNRRIYFTMGDEGVGNRNGLWLETLVAAFETSAPKGLKWAFVDRSSEEEHRTMALTGWLDAFRTLYLTPSRSGNPLPLVYEDFEAPTYSAEARANIDAGTCRHAIATAVTFEEKNSAPAAYYGRCLLMKPGQKLTAGNFALGELGLDEDLEIVPE
ncbi:alpha/beta hydrolase [Novosphingopyxis iocasae]|uniref:alpha/beta hydrolase n=1 Tax=Novosphingopyxis iocasae TaxID=2762729 RepID=UPI0016510F6D|nr:alpha/beta hydrolase-fold protein [Novosphingopyxis iocasae]